MIPMSTFQGVIRTLLYVKTTMRRKNYTQTMCKLFFLVNILHSFCLLNLLVALYIGDKRVKNVIYFHFRVRLFLRSRYFTHTFRSDQCSLAAPAPHGANAAAMNRNLQGGILKGNMDYREIANSYLTHTDQSHRLQEKETVC